MTKDSTALCVTGITEACVGVCLPAGALLFCAPESGTWAATALGSQYLTFWFPPIIFLIPEERGASEEDFLEFFFFFLSWRMYS